MSSIIESKYLINPRVFCIEEPQLQFSTSRSTIDQSPLTGLANYKPYDYNTNNRNFSHLRFIIICPSSGELINKTEQFLHYLINGIRYSKGIKDDFQLESVEIPSKNDYYKYSIDDLQSERQAIFEAIRYERTDLSFRDNTRLCVIFIGKDISGFRNTESYYQSKRLLLNNGFPTQYISINNSLSSICDYKNEYALRNIATNIYVKIGGIPWTLFNNQNNMGSSICIGYAFGRVRRKGQDKYVPCTFSIFDKLGLWLGSFTTTLRNPIPSHTCDGMILSEEQSFGLLSEILEKYASQKDLSRLERISIHKLGFLGNDELNGFQQALSSERNIQEFAFVSVNTRSNMRIVDETSPTGNVKRGTVVILSRNSGILFSTGDTLSVYNKKVKLHQLGTPAPLYISLQRYNSNKDHEEFFESCIREIFHLTALHWENIWQLEYRLPVTLKYSQKAAKLIANGVDVHNELENTPWFL